MAITIFTGYVGKRCQVNNMHVPAYLVHGRRGGGTMGELLELLVTVVIDEDVQGEDVPDGLQRVVVQRRHGRVVDGQHGDGLPPVDVVRQPRLGQHLVEL